MIDWVTCKLPLRAAEEHLVGGGYFILSDADGAVERLSPRPLAVEGSHDSRLHVRTHGSYLYLTGNPVKWWQGHNLWGTDDLKPLINATADRVCQLIGLAVTPQDRAAWSAGYVPLHRVDATVMLHYQSRADVRSVIRAASLNARSRHGAAVTRGGTVYLGLRSRRWTVKLYSKGDELEARGRSHHLPAEIEHRDELREWADTALRVELQMRTLELDRRGLGLSRAWTPTTAPEMLNAKVQSITMSTTHKLPSTELDELPGRLIAVYEAWRAGHDIRAIYSKSTFYRYRKELLEYAGIDIHLPAPPADAEDLSNVVPLNRLIEGTPTAVPEWALGTALYFEPAAIRCAG